MYIDGLIHYDLATPADWFSFEKGGLDAIKTAYELARQELAVSNIKPDNTGFDIVLCALVCGVIRLARDTDKNTEVILHQARKMADHQYKAGALLATVAGTDRVQ